MGLRVDEGKEIVAAAALINPVKLKNILRDPQTQTLWCWVACARMILLAKGKNDTQCQIAQKALPANLQCCSTPAKCNQALDPAKIQEHWKSLGNPNVKPHCGVLEPAEIRTELGKGPIEAWLGNMEDCPTFQGSGHVLLIVGCHDGPSGETLVTIRDPNPNFDSTEVPYQSLLKDLSYGPWVGFWTGI